MGLLDDAIREHLELKRRSGADPGDVARLEREAFGAAANAAEPAQAVAEPVSGAVEEQHVVVEHEHVVVDPAPEAAQHEVADPLPAQQHVVVDPAPADPAHVVADSAGQLREPDPAAAPAAEESEQATRQFTALEAEEAQRPPPPAGRTPEEEEEVHDELEQTPDFLQETPDHDRLWFEQKPPRDFDF